VAVRFFRALLIIACIMPVWGGARAAVVDGVELPPTVDVNGKTLLLNGYGQRTYSILGIHIYVAALYLEHPSNNPEAIIRSPETRLLTVSFEHNVDAAQAQKAWRDGLQNNCRAPCQLDPAEVQKFLAEVPGMHAGDNFNLVFTQNGAIVRVDGQQLGVVSNRPFAEAMLATFLGPNPASPRLKEELLGSRP
jgi:hypothetical protein